MYKLLNRKSGTDSMTDKPQLVQAWYSDITLLRFFVHQGEPTISLTEPIISRVLAVFPTQRFHQPRSGAPPPTPTIVNSKNPSTRGLVSGHLTRAAHAVP